MSRVGKIRTWGAIALAAVCVACTSQPTDDQTPEPSAAQPGPAGAVPDGLEDYYGQPVEWRGCEDFATSPEEETAVGADGLECAHLRVPLDYDDPEGEEIRLGVLRRPAEDPGTRIGSLLVNPGGPGAGGVPTAAALAPEIADTELGRRFDLVGFDPRGLGTSEPALQCWTTEERDAYRVDQVADASPEAVARNDADQRAYAEACEQRNGAEFLASLGTTTVARDLDVLRSALGDEGLTYLGYSYGTRLGSTYAALFPDNVRALVLDGALDPDADPVEQRVDQQAGFQLAFEAFADWCAEQSPCVLGSDPDQAVEVFRELVDPLADQPAAAGERLLSYPDAITGTIQSLYAQDFWPVLNQGLMQLSVGDGSTLLLLADVYNGRSPTDGSYSTMMDGFTAVRCVDDPPITDDEVLTELDRRAREAAPFLDDGGEPGPLRDACAFWPVPPNEAPPAPDAERLPTTLVVSVTGDPATPYEAGVELADALGGRLLTYEGNQHGVVLQGSDCVDEIATDYLVDLDAPAEDVTC
ncbi:alpha/beta hydrolase [Actinoalloteichus caeruleus]|uniref:alpha/beta hydrolase n=1 Tax=Actinoalloteichus cyanogriseus TaxID=2893586 RepID=UPI00047BB52D|nr:alpha/beta hydrolase [Actinoalloteichus caeruleus]